LDFFNKVSCINASSKYLHFISSSLYKCIIFYLLGWFYSLLDVEVPPLSRVYHFYDAI